MKSSPFWGSQWLRGREDGKRKNRDESRMEKRVGNASLCLLSSNSFTEYVVRLLSGARQYPRMRIRGDDGINLGNTVEKSGTIAGVHVIRGSRGEME